MNTLTAIEKVKKKKRIMMENLRVSQLARVGEAILHLSVRFGSLQSLLFAAF